jgi:hypothetical protein
MNDTFTFTDELIATVAKMLQLSMLTGTDLYDQLATLQCVLVDGKAAVAPEFKAKLDAEIQRLQDAATAASQQTGLGSVFDTN